MKPAYGEIKPELIKKIGQLGLFFTTHEIRLVFMDLGISINLISQSMALLIKDGILQRVKNGIYTLTSDFNGRQAAHPFLIAMKLSPGCIISGWSALNYHELTEQIPRSIYLTIGRGSTRFRKTKNVPDSKKLIWSDSCTKKIGLNVFVIFTTVKQDRLFGIKNVDGFENVGMKEEQVRIFDKERAVMDCFVFPEKFGGLSTGLGILEEHLHRLDIGKLVQYAIKYESFTLRRRLGWSLEELGVPEIQYAPLLEHMRNKNDREWEFLDPTSAPIKNWNCRWKIHNNLIRRGDGR